MRIKALVVGAASEGGVRDYVNLVASHCDPETVEWHTTVASTKRDDPASRQPQMITHRLAVTYSIRSLPIRVMQLRKLLKQGRFDLLHLHTARAGLLGCLSSVGLPAAIVFTPHGWRSEDKKSDMRNPIFGAVDRYVCSRADMVTVECHRNLDLGIRRGLAAKNKMVMINTEIDGTPFQSVDSSRVRMGRQDFGIPDDAYVIGMVGRMEPRKDPFTFVRAAAKVISRLPNACFLWVGDGDLRNPTLRLASELRLSERLIIAGMRPESELPVLFHMMDMVLFTSHFEGLPLTILEAQAARRPVVCSAYPGVEELVEGGQTGYTFPPGDDEEAARAVLMAWRDPDEARRLVDGATARFLEKHSDPRRMAREYERVYARALKDDRRQNSDHAA